MRTSVTRMRTSVTRVSRSIYTHAKVVTRASRSIYTHVKVCVPFVTLVPAVSTLRPHIIVA
jgi:hypothetical protein